MRSDVSYEPPSELLGPRPELVHDDPVQARRYRLLIIASALDGTDISEAEVAYDWASRLAARHDVTILTYRKRDRASARDQIPGARFVEWTEWPLLHRAQTVNNMLQPYYVGFYASARRWIRRALAAGEHFDLVHQLTPEAVRYPSPAIGLIDPVVIGPLGGALPTPAGFEAEMAAVPWYTKLRSLDQWRLRNDPILRGSMSGASLILGEAPYVLDVLSDVPLKRFEVMSEHGLEELPTVERKLGQPGELRGLFVGRIIRSKGVRDAIRALGRLGDLPQVTLDIVGDGDDRQQCAAEVAELGLTDRVRFHGWMAKSEVRRYYEAADAFVFPSFREPGGRVVLEAMSFGLPVIAADYGGPAALVGPDAGVRVKCESPGQFVDDIAQAMRQLAEDPQARLRVGDAGRHRAGESYLWPKRIEHLETLYAEVIGR